LYNKMLLPLDGSKLAEEILPYAQEVAAALRSNVVVLNITGSADLEIEMNRVYVKSMVEHLHDELGHIVTQHGSDSNGAIKITGEVRTGYPAEEISKFASENGIDFIMLSPYGQSGVRRWSLGGTTEKVTRSSRVPVWIGRFKYSNNKKDISWPINNILIPLDGSDLSECVIPFVKDIAKLALARKAEITLFNVNEPLMVNADYPEKIMHMSWDEHVKYQTLWMEKTSQEYLNNVKRKLEDTGFKVKTEITIGNPTEMILNYAISKSINLIILATHGRSGITRLEYGNVADKILHRSRIPIFLVRPEACYFE
jgi:nucleotide-binding universal stress UspA family protein